MIGEVRLLVLTCVLGRVGSSCNWDVSTQGCPSGGRTHPTWQCLAQQKNCPFTWAQVQATMPTFCLVGDRCENKPMYHCGKLQNGSWAERCAAGVGCRPGHVPVLPNEENGWATCSIPCRDPERYNNDNMFSAWDYRCSYAKRSCRADQHMHTCWNGSNTQNRRCTCDVRNGWILGNDWGSHRLFKYCFFFSDWWCQYSPCVDPETERLINWTCAAKCPTNYARLSYVHDECMWNGSTTTATTTTISTTTPSTTTTTTTTTTSTTTTTEPTTQPMTRLVCPTLEPGALKVPELQTPEPLMDHRRAERLESVMDLLPGDGDEVCTGFIIGVTGGSLAVLLCGALIILYLRQLRPLQGRLHTAQRRERVQENAKQESPSSYVSLDPEIINDDDQEISETKIGKLEVL